MTLSSQLGNTVAETCLPADQCNACTRKGLPILPLRHAVVSRSPEDPIALSNTRMGIRTLRAGYLYVLLDRLVWQAYQVTPDGYLRQFNPDAPPAANETLLCDACTSAEHDAPASFLNIDTQKYSQAWLAFASDPWPRSILDRYKQGHMPERFRKLDLAAVRDNPGSLENALIMNAENPRVNKEVYEYKFHPRETRILQPHLPLTSLHYDFRMDKYKPRNVAFESAHGFYSRITRVNALKSFLSNTIKNHGLQHGVVAIVLDDTLGLVQEYNHFRNGWVSTRQQFKEEPMTAYKYQTSQLLVAIREKHRALAEQTTPVLAENPLRGAWPTVYAYDSEKQHEHTVSEKAQRYNDSLESRYSERDRAQFQDYYDQRIIDFQISIDSCGYFYAQACRTKEFKCIEQNDYDGNDFASGLAYSQTMALCLCGGVSEASPTRDTFKKLVADTGPTATLWSGWMNNPESPIYRALLLRDKSLLAGLLPSFSGEGEPEWNDSEKLYSAISAILTSDQANKFHPSLKNAIAHLIGPLNAPSARLQPSLSPNIKRVASKLNSASQLLYNGVHLTEIKITIKLSEYYSLQSEHLRNLQRKASDAINKIWENSKDGLGTVDYETTKLYRKVTPFIQGGLLSLAVLDPKLHDLKIPVSLWVEGDATKLQQQLMHEANRVVNRVGKGLHETLEAIAVGIGSLDPKARQLLNGMTVSSQQAAQWVRTGFTGLRGIGGSGELLLAIGSFYLLNDSLKRNLEEAEQAIGDKSVEANLALAGSTLGVLGGGMELVGKSLEKAAERIQNTSPLSAQASGRVATSIKLGITLAKSGAIISAVSGVFDATQSAMAANRTLKGGDSSAAGLYILSAGFYGAGAVYGTLAAVTGTATLFGPLGIAILLGFAGYGLYKWAEREESTPLERWAKRCYFGNHDEVPSIHWNKPEYGHIAIAELNAITLGIEAEVDFQRRKVAVGGSYKDSGRFADEQHLKFRIILPHFDTSQSAYRWTLTINHSYAPRKGVSSTVVAEGSHNPPPVHTAISNKNITSETSESTKKNSHPNIKAAPTLRTTTAKSTDGKTFFSQEITGNIELPEKRLYTAEEAILSLTYWPDRDAHDGYAELVLTSTQ